MVTSHLLSTNPNPTLVLRLACGKWVLWIEVVICGQKWGTTSNWVEFQPGINVEMMLQKGNDATKRKIGTGKHRLK